MKQLPTDIIDYIITISDIDVKVKLYNNKCLQTIISVSLFISIEQEVYNTYSYIHKCNLSKCLNCLRYHVWNDGTPMKKRQCHYVKNINKYRKPEYSLMWYNQNKIVL